MAAEPVFILRIGLGNAAMSDSEDVAQALEKVAADVVEGPANGLYAGKGSMIRDANGNTVGAWEVIGRPQ
jgi:hypothetical protein